MDLHKLIHHAWPYIGVAWPYLATFGWTFVEGETFVVVAGFAASQGVFSAPLLLVAAWLGSFSGDQCYFWIGRRFGLRLLSRRPAWRSRVDSALGWLKRYDIGFILCFRFIYGIRNIASFTLGISGIAWQRFFVLNFIAAFLWALTFVGAGYFCGRTVMKLVGEGEYAEHSRWAMIGGFALVLIVVTILHRWRAYRRRRAQAAPSEATPAQ
jgi:membrane protein DedA with SNARE-associated domain